MKAKVELNELIESFVQKNPTADDCSKVVNSFVKKNLYLKLPAQFERLVKMLLNCQGLTVEMVRPLLIDDCVHDVSLTACTVISSMKSATPEDFAKIISLHAKLRFKAPAVNNTEGWQRFVTNNQLNYFHLLVENHWDFSAVCASFPSLIAWSSEIENTVKKVIDEADKKFRSMNIDQSREYQLKIVTLVTDLHNVRVAIVKQEKEYLLTSIDELMEKVAKTFFQNITDPQLNGLWDLIHCFEPGTNIRKQGVQFFETKIIVSVPGCWLLDMVENDNSKVAAERILDNSSMNMFTHFLIAVAVKIPKYREIAFQMLFKKYLLWEELLQLEQYFPHDERIKKIKNERSVSHLIKDIADMAALEE